jgi:hypothetical protein
MMDNTEATRALADERVQQHRHEAELRRQAGRKRRPRHVFRTFFTTIRP